MYTNALGDVEQNKLFMSRPLVDFSTGTQQQINPHTMEALKLGEMLRGGIDVQEAVAGNLPVTMQGRTGKKGMDSSACRATRRLG